LVSPLDVALLGRLVATTQQQDHTLTVVQVVHPVTWTEPQPKLPDSPPNRFGIARIARRQPVQTFDDPQPAGPILELP